MHSFISSELFNQILNLMITGHAHMQLSCFMEPAIDFAHANRNHFKSIVENRFPMTFSPIPDLLSMAVDPVSHVRQIPSLL